MMAIQTPYTILIRRDTEELFNELNPILRDKELVCVKIDNNTYKYKYGDGKSKYSELEFVNSIYDIDIIKIYDPKSNTRWATIDLNPFNHFYNEEYMQKERENDIEYKKYQFIQKLLKYSKDYAVLCSENVILPKGTFQMARDLYYAKLPCLKLGDGEKCYNDLPFIDDNLSINNNK